MFRIAPFATALVAVTAMADDKKPASPDTAAMMEAMEKLGKPGPEHKKLDPLVGNWTYTAKFWMAPGTPPMEMKGEDKSAWIMGGKFIQAEVNGPAQAGMPAFEGRAITGYDNATKKYVSSWIDNMTTSVMHMTGEMDAAGKVLTLNYDEFDPMTGKMCKARQVLRIGGPNSHDLEFWKVMPDGKDMKTGEIKYTRKK